VVVHDKSSKVSDKRASVALDSYTHSNEEEEEVADEEEIMDELSDDDYVDAFSNFEDEDEKLIHIHR